MNWFIYAVKNFLVVTIHDSRICLIYFLFLEWFMGLVCFICVRVDASPFQTNEKFGPGDIQKEKYPEKKMSGNCFYMLFSFFMERIFRITTMWVQRNCPLGRLVCLISAFVDFVYLNLNGFFFNKKKVWLKYQSLNEFKKMAQTGMTVLFDYIITWIFSSALVMAGSQIISWIANTSAVLFFAFPTDRYYNLHCFYHSMCHLISASISLTERNLSVI